MAKYSREYYLDNKEVIKAKSKKYRELNKEKLRIKAKKRCTPEYTKNIVLKTKYGISLDDYNEMFQNQKGCCAVCDRHQSELNHSLHVDHCHNTNKVRALLCSNCNSGIGNLQDSKEMLSKAIKYLERYE